MRRLVSSAIPLAILFLSAIPTLAQERSAEIQWLDSQVGEWTHTASDGSSGTSVCKWLGDSFMQCNGAGVDSLGITSSSLEVMDYDAEEGVYNLSYFSSDGGRFIGTGELQNDTLTWLADVPGFGKVRATNVNESQDAWTFKIELSVEGGEWEVISEGRATRVR